MYVRGRLTFEIKSFALMDIYRRSYASEFTSVVDLSHVDNKIKEKAKLGLKSLIVRATSITFPVWYT